MGTSTPSPTSSAHSSTTHDSAKMPGKQLSDQCSRFSGFFSPQNYQMDFLNQSTLNWQLFCEEYLPITLFWIFLAWQTWNTDNAKNFERVDFSRTETHIFSSVPVWFIPLRCPSCFEKICFHFPDRSFEEMDKNSKKWNNFQRFHSSSCSSEITDWIFWSTPLSLPFICRSAVSKIFIKLVPCIEELIGRKRP